MIQYRPIPDATKRKKFSLAEKLAACLLRMAGPDGGPLVPGGKDMTVKEINASVAFDHAIALDLGGSNHPSNIQPLPRRYHETVKTPADQTKIIKARHNRNTERRHRAVMEARTIGDDLPRDVKKHRIPQRPDPGHRREAGRSSRGRWSVAHEVRTDAAATSAKRKNRRGLGDQAPVDLGLSSGFHQLRDHQGSHAPGHGVCGVVASAGREDRIEF